MEGRSPRLRATLCLVLGAAWLACTPADPRPSIVLVVIDTLRADAVSAYGAVEGTTPGIDALASQGLLYTRAYAPSPWTIPSHATLFTGLGIETHGTGLAGQSSLPERFVTLAERLADAGYETAAFSENIIVSDPFQLLQGFSHRRTNGLVELLREGEDAPVDHLLAIDLEEYIGGWLGTRDVNRPFFLFVNVFEVHAPYEVREENAWVPETASPTEMGRFADKPENHICANLPSERDREILRGLYLGDVFDADREVQSLLAQVSASETRGDLITVVTSDHGEFFGEGGLLGHEFSVRHGALHIPLVVAGLPGVDPGVIDTPVRLVDLSASVLAWAGLEQPAEFAGTPLPTAPEANLEGARSVRAAYSDSATVMPERWGDTILPLDRETQRASCGPEHKVFGGMASLIEFPYKFNWFERYAPELYDLRWDVAERSDVAPHQPELVARFTREIAEFVGATGLAGRERQPEEEPSKEAIEALRALGYIDE